MFAGKPIILMGFMGSGKSTLGKALARELSLPFTDLDRYIERETGRKVGDIFSQEGESRFRELEKAYLPQLIGQVQGVIAIGGGAPCVEENLKLIREKALSVYVKVSVNELAHRLSFSPTPRPLLAGKTGTELEFLIKNLLNSREKHYSQADVILESDRLTTEELVRAILPYA